MSYLFGMISFHFTLFGHILDYKIIIFWGHHIIDYVTCFNDIIVDGRHKDYFTCLFINYDGCQDGSYE